MNICGYPRLVCDCGHHETGLPDDHRHREAGGMKCPRCAQEMFAVTQRGGLATRIDTGARVAWPPEIKRL